MRFFEGFLGLEEVLRGYVCAPQPVRGAGRRRAVRVMRSAGCVGSRNAVVHARLWSRYLALLSGCDLRLILVFFLLTMDITYVRVSDTMDCRLCLG